MKRLLTIALLLAVPAIAQAPQWNHAGKPIEWQLIKQKDWGGKLARSRVPGGWFVSIYSGIPQSSFFYPDPEHTWQPEVEKPASWDE